MRTNYSLLLITGMMAFLFLASCNNSATIAFPEKELGYTQPVTLPLQFTAEKKLIFDTAKQGGIKPVIKKLDLESLPSMPYDSTGFQAFPLLPETSPVDLNSLHDTAFSLDKLPSESLHFKTYALNPPAALKVTSPAAQRAHPLAIYDFGPKLGLPALFITSLLKDKDGLMWIGSKEGLFRYDGEHIQTILPGTGETSVASMAEDNEGRIWFIDQIRVGMIDIRKGTISYSNVTTVTKNNLSKIIKDKKGRIWISKTISRSVFIIDPVAQTFKKLSRSTGLSDDQGANDITEDSNGNILITTPSGGADIINVEQGKIKYLDKTRGLAKDSLRAITIDKTGRIWIGIAGGGVDAVNPKSGTITHYTNLQGLKPAFIGDISADDKGKIWIGKSRGLDILDPDHNRNRFLDDSRGLIDSWVSSCTEDNNHRMWVSTIGGLHMIDQHGETVHPLGALNIVTLMEDTVGNLWVGTQKGIRLIDARKKLIRVLDKTHGLGNDFVQSFVKFNPQMWVTSDGGLDIINPINKTIEHIGKKEGLVSDTVYVAYKDKAGNTWFTGPSNGIDLIDSANQRILHTDVAGGLADNNILDVKEDNNGLVWLAGSIGGINIIDLKKRTVKYLNNQPGLRDTSTKTMLTDHYGRLWIGTDKGIYVVDKERGTLTSITTSQGLSHNKVTSLLEYKGCVIAGTQDKVTMITAPEPGNTDSTNGKWNIAILNKSEGLVREVTNAWATDAITQKGQYLWGDNGITVINDIQPTGDSSPTFVTGLNVMNSPQYFINKEELKGNDTVRVSDTFYIKGQTPVIAGYANTKTIRWDSVAGAYNMPADLQIPYNQNYMQFQFTQAHLGRQDATRYTYILEGIDKNWSSLTTNTYTENYLNLPPGKYTFKVSSKEVSGKWSDPASFSFTILPPWWKTWWAYTLLVLLCAGILRAYIMYRSAKLQRENKVLEEKVNLRTQQLLQSIEDLKSTQTQLIQSEKMASLGELTAGIAHEIQNPLNFINNFSDVNAELIADLKEELNHGNIEEVKAIAGNIEANERKINHHGKRADSIVKGMLQHSRTGSRQKETANINSLADEYFRLAYHGLRAKDKSFNATLKTDFDENIDQVNIIPQDIGRVILNLITNAFYTVAEKKKNTADKVSGDKYEPTVWVATKKAGDKIEIKVKDNGNGIPLKVRDKIFQPFFTTKPTGQGTGLGLSLAYDIVKAHGGELRVDTKEGEGSEFTIQLPL